MNLCDCRYDICYQVKISYTKKNGKDEVIEHLEGEEGWLISDFFFEDGEFACDLVHEKVLVSPAPHTQPLPASRARSCKGAPGRTGTRDGADLALRVCSRARPCPRSRRNSPAPLTRATGACPLSQDLIDVIRASGETDKDK